MGGKLALAFITEALDDDARIVDGPVLFCEAVLNGFSTIRDSIGRLTRANERCREKGYLAPLRP